MASVIHTLNRFINYNNLGKPVKYKLVYLIKNYGLNICLTRHSQSDKIEE